MSAETAVDLDAFFEQSDSRSKSYFKTKAFAVTAVLTATGVAGRVALQHVPSVEPLIAVAAATGFYFGMREGVAAGATGYYISNFLVWGGQGPWTFFQVLGAAAAGVTGGLAGNISKGRNAFLVSTAVGLVVYEVVINLASVGFMASGFSFAFMAAALPFAFAHLVSTVGFGLILYGSKEKIGLYR
ncbi:hypothetical protein [Candidatus Nanohalovita haloferacivicina]|uniref:hypothetical protein n=1 Tax=Candidatus Nanohalovita haloferacivicina TaxID=2978046 RepID=UPI00325FB6AD|nr:putative membrane protein [Candidatus Nanohalobia archaeon BNXNv]